VHGDAAPAGSVKARVVWAAVTVALVLALAYSCAILLRLPEYG
jgi:hypothetical protein